MSETTSSVTLASAATLNVPAAGASDLLILLRPSPTQANNFSSQNIRVSDFLASGQLIGTNGSVQEVLAGSALSLIAGSSYDVTLTAPCVFTPSGGEPGTVQTITVYLRQNSTAGWLPTFGANVTWPGGLPPAFNRSAGAFDIVQLSTIDGQNFVGVMIASSVASPTLPGVPTGVSAAAGNNSITLSAIGVPAVPAVSGYNIRRATVSNGEASTAPIAFNATLPFQDVTAVNGTQYFYQISAVSQAGESALSAEVSATPSSTAGFAHHATFAAGSLGYIYTPDQAQFNPQGNPFSYRAKFLPSSATGQTNQAIMGIYQVGQASLSETLFYLKSDGTLHVAWTNTAGVVCDVGSPSPVPFVGSVPLWCRADVAPTTGVASFFVSADGVAWTPLGGAQQAGTFGAVQAGTVSSSLIMGQTSANGIEFTGDLYAAQLIINGVAVASPICGPASTSDATGNIWITSPTGVVYV